MGVLEKPHDADAERHLLSALLIRGGEAVPKAAAILEDGDFFEPQNRALYRAIVHLYNSGASVNVLSLVDILQKSGELEKIGLERVHVLALLEPTNAYVESYAGLIKEKSILRRLVEIGEAVSDSAYRGVKAVDEIILDAESQIFNLHTNRSVGFEPVKGILDRSYHELEQIINSGAIASGVESGFIDLDRLTSGFQKTDLILLAARPSMGKTAFALNVATNAALSGKVVVIFSLEMSKMQIGRRLLLSHSGVSWGKFQNRSVSSVEWGVILDSYEELSEAKMYIDDTSALKVAEIRANARRLKLEHEVDLIVIDYLQLIQGGRRTSENRQQEISAISRELKALAKELDVPVIALSQLSRSVELRGDKRPMLSDLRDSGALEQDADIVMFLYRDDYYDRETEDTGTAELIVAKNRNGATATIKLFFDRECMRFGSLVAD